MSAPRSPRSCARAMQRAWLLLLCLVAGSRELSIKEFSVPATLEAGEDARLQCKYDLLANESERALFVKWWWTPVNGSDQRTQLYQRIAGYKPEAIQDNVELDENDGIRLLNVTPLDSGIYECEVSNIDEVRQHQKLVVFSIGSGPQVNVSQSEDGVQVSCAADDVAPHPDIVISLNGVVVESSGYVSEPEYGRYDIYENATLTVDEANGGEFRCEIFFRDEAVVHAPYVASQTFESPTAEAPAPAPPAAAPPPPPSDNGSVMTGTSWMLLMLAIISLCFCLAANM